MYLVVVTYPTLNTSWKAKATTLVDGEKCPKYFPTNPCQRSNHHNRQATEGLEPLPGTINLTNNYYNKHLGHVGTFSVAAGANETKVTPSIPIRKIPTTHPRPLQRKTHLCYKRRNPNKAKTQFSLTRLTDQRPCRHLPRHHHHNRLPKPPMMRQPLLSCYWMSRQEDLN